ncbi:MAG TPA: ATP-binding protein, partial [Cryomorphaceae bacterium]|nr:ATP-binding protein [Cryomorphaceae bacterium]
SQLIQSEKMASLGELTAGIAHEIQNPLNFVNNFSEVSNELIDEATEELVKTQHAASPDNEAKDHQEEISEALAILGDVKQNLAKITHHGKRADAIVKGMLAHSLSGKGEKSPTDLNALAEEYLKLSYHGLRAKDKNFNADFKTDFDPNLPKVNVVPQDIGRVLLNLINNAFQACTEQRLLSGVEASRSAVRTKHASFQQPLVTVKTQLSTSDQVLVTITDNGPGIPHSIKDKIFQPFFTTKPTGQGTGLGLSLSYDIVKAHGGEIRVESLPAGQVGEEGEGLPAHQTGTTFIVTLPFKINQKS